MGWLGWTWEQIRHEDVNRLLLALEGRTELLTALFGSGKSAPPPRRPMSNDSWRAFAARHNARYAAKGKRSGGGGS